MKEKLTLYDLKHEKKLHQSMSTNLLGVVLGDDFPFQPLNIFMIQFMDPTVRGTILRTKTHNTTLLHHSTYFLLVEKLWSTLFVGGVYQAIENLQ